MSNKKYHAKYTSTHDGYFGHYWAVVLDDPSEWSGKEFHTGLYLVFKWEPEAKTLVAIARCWKLPRFHLTPCETLEQAEEMIDQYVKDYHNE
ncbi:hypothetical protein [Synechococcus phage S-B68]|nr:hypothetical protein [Synechococcus phage S-B68]